MISHEVQIRVRYKDTDKMGVVYHSNYIVFYEVARTELFRAMGLPYSELERRGVISPIIEVESRYLAPAYYDELITVRAMISEEPMARLNVTYEVLGEDGKLINTGKTVLGFVNTRNMHPCRVPEELAEKIREQL